MKRLARIVVILSCLVALISCSGDADASRSRGESTEQTTSSTQTETAQFQERQSSITSEDYGYELARYVQSVVSGEVRPTSSLRVIFTSNMVSADQVGKEAEKISFHFTPSLRGKAVWQSRNELNFVPAKPMPQRQKYTASLDINPLLDRTDIKPLDFTFSVLGQSLVRFNGEFSYESTEKAVVYAGAVEFMLPVEHADLEKGVQLRNPDGKVDIHWMQDADAQHWHYQSKPINRGTLAKDFTLTFAADRFNLEEDFSRTFTLESLNKMTLMQTLRHHDADRPWLELKFTENIAPDLNIESYVRIDESVNLRVKSYGNTIKLTGDFNYGKTYNVTVRKELKSDIGNTLDKPLELSIVFNDELPRISFTQDGALLSTSSHRRLRFRTINLTNVRMTIKKVYENNLIYFLQNNDLNSYKTYSDSWYYGMDRLGTTVVEQELQIGVVKNQWLEHELDLSKLIPPGEQGLFAVELRFEKKDIEYQGIKDGGNNSYYTSPYNRGYYYRNGSVSKPLVVTDLGVTAKQTTHAVDVFVNNVIDTKPQNGAEVKLLTLQNQIISKGTSDGNGHVHLPIMEEKPYYVEVHHNNQRSIVPLDQMRWNLSTYEVAGEDAAQSGIRSYVYTSRGVYRPGDTLHVAMLFRNKDNTLPSNHPVNLTLRDPRNKVVHSTVLKNGVDGFYSFQWATDPKAPTGTWNVVFRVGNETVYHSVKIETIVAEQLKVVLSSNPEHVVDIGKSMKIQVQAHYLFGTPAENRPVNITSEVIPYTHDFEAWRAFDFTNATVRNDRQNFTVGRGQTGADGSFNATWSLQNKITPSSALMLKLEAEVGESGGRSSKGRYYLPVDPFTAYAGIRTDQSRWLKLNQENLISFVLVDTAGKALPNEELQVRIYHNRSYWWWEMEHDHRKRSHFRQDSETALVLEKTINSEGNAVDLEFTPSEWGEYLVEVTHVTQDGDGHVAALFFNSSYWRNTRSMRDAGMIVLNSDKAQYHPGETAEVSFPVPRKCKALVCIEKGSEILNYRWVTPKKDDIARVSIPITAEMEPNVYCSISIIQPHEQTQNDRPLRMFGVIPLMVNDPDSHQEITLDMPEVLQPGKPFSCTIQTADQQPTQFTIAVVDEGLLNLTDFASPNAWSAFNRKERLGVETSDNYLYFIGADKGDVYSTFSVGGDYAMRKAARKASLEQKLDPELVKRFKPVCMFKGPLSTDDSGRAIVNFEMPQYVGAVRVMVISAAGKRYGAVSTTIPVKSNLMLLSTLPRMLAPEDEIEIPVSVFVQKKNLGNVTISASAEGPVQLVGKASQVLKCDAMGQQNVLFRLKVKPAVGVAVITLQATGKDVDERWVTEIAVSSYSPELFSTTTYTIAPDTTLNMDVPLKGMSHYGSASLEISKLPQPDVESHLGRLVHYPYGCVEQTVSAVVPQLFLKELLGPQNVSDDVTYNINRAIDRLRKFQLADGSLAYWPGFTETSQWGTIWAGYFVAEAQNLGYFVPSDIIGGITNYLDRVANRYNLQTENRALFKQLYRLFVLARLNQPNVSAMNLVREEMLSKMDDTERWLLAASYQLAGMPTAAAEISRTAGVVVKDYRELRNTFGSPLRDKALILQAMLVLNSDKAEALYFDIVDKLNLDNWYSTQELGMALTACGLYHQKHSSVDVHAAEVRGSITLPDGSELPVNFKNDKQKVELPPQVIDSSIQVHIAPNEKLKTLYVKLNQKYLPLKPEATTIQEGLALKRRWNNENGTEIGVASLSQGTNFQEIITVTNTSDRALYNVALEQILPRGWEVENLRLTGKDSAPQGVYKDIRDDRVRWFFDIPAGHSQTYIINLRAITKGQFYLPPVHCHAMYNQLYQAVIAGEPVTVH
jgi:uncharacterized protein YfaS (alpha-2-macroglobulin family)